MLCRLQTLLRSLDELGVDRTRWKQSDGERGRKLLVAGGFKYDASTSGPLNERIRTINLWTAVRTFINTAVGDAVPLPNGLGLFRFDSRLVEQLRRVEDDVKRLFSSEENYASFSSFTKRKPKSKRVDFVALYWENQDKVCSTLEEVLKDFDTHGYKDLLDLVKTIYVPMLSSVLEISEDVVLQAPTEMIYYPADSGSGLEQHIDNVTRTGWVVGPICSINFVGSRCFDMLPSCVEGEPFRIETNSGDLLILDSVARILWSHAVPFDSSENRFSLVIRPIIDGSQSGDPIGWSKSLNIPVYQPTAALRRDDGSKLDGVPVKAAVVEAGLGGRVVDYDIVGFWEQQGVGRIIFYRNLNTMGSIKDMKVALWRNKNLKGIVSSSNPVIWEAYGHDGADTLTFLYSFPGSPVTSIYHGERFKNLENNVTSFKNVYSPCGESSILKGTFGNNCSAIPACVDLLYLDPKWRRDLSSDEYNVLEMCRELKAEIFDPCGSKLGSVKNICFKVRYDWPFFQRIMLMCDLKGFVHVLTMDVANDKKHHYFHVISRGGNDLQNRVKYDMGMASSAPRTRTQNVSRGLDRGRERGRR